LPTASAFCRQIGDQRKEPKILLPPLSRTAMNKPLRGWRICRLKKDNGWAKALSPVYRIKRTLKAALCAPTPGAAPFRGQNGGRADRESLQARWHRGWWGCERIAQENAAGDEVVEREDDQDLQEHGARYGA